MTNSQRTLLRRLCAETGEPFEQDLSRQQAARRIEVLHERSGGTPPARVLMDDQTDG